METTCNIVLVDDHVLIRKGLRTLIEKLGNFKIQEEFENGEDLLAYLPNNALPDLIILDINMPIMNGDEVLEKLKEKGYKIPVLVLTVNEDEKIIIRMFRLGARGYLKKNCRSEELKTAINSILTVGYYHNEFLTYSLETEEDPSFFSKKMVSMEVLEKFSPREREFIKWVCFEKEYTYEEIADAMNVSIRTINGYREAIADKTGVKSKAGMVLYVLRHHLYDYL